MRQVYKTNIVNQPVANQEAAPTETLPMLPVEPVPLAQAVPMAAMNLQFDIDSVVAIGVDGILAALDEAKRKVVGQAEQVSKDLSARRRELSDLLAAFGCPGLRADLEPFCQAVQALGDSARVTYTVGEPDRKARTYGVTANVTPLRNRPWDFHRDQAMQPDQLAVLDDIEALESQHSKLTAALAELSRRSNEQAVTRKARAAAARHVYGKNEDGKALVNAIAASVPSVDDILAGLLN